ncbi:hypothetical protein LINGRAHAP2_LOCUS11420, partial [Linum grandiflorum]
AEVENQLNKKIKRLRSDRGGEYSSVFLKQVCEEAGMQNSLRIHFLSKLSLPNVSGKIPVLHKVRSQAVRQ